MMERAAIGLLVGLALAISVGAEPHLEGQVRLASGEPAVGAQVLLFDSADLRTAPVAATTDQSGRFTLPLARLAGVLPERFELGANYPNPFNPSTIIPYQLPSAMRVRLEVFNLLGQRVATLVDGEQRAGLHKASWDATDAAGEAVAAGVYLYRLTGDGVQATRSMLLIDGQAGISWGRGGSTARGGAADDRRNGETVPVFGLAVSGPGLVPYVNPAFQVKVGMAPLELVVEAAGRVPRAKAASSGGILGDVDNNGRVDFLDAVLVALYSRDAKAMPNNGDISLGDVDTDGQVDLTDAWLIAVWLKNPSDPALPAGIGEPVGGTLASLSPDPSTVTFAADGAWHRFTVEAGEQVSVVVNPEGTTPRLEITTRSGRGNYCPAEADDDVSRRDGQAVYLAGCGTGTATVELRRPSDGTVLRIYTFEVTGSPADLVVESVSVSDNTLTPGQSFTLRVTVRNQGTAGAKATTLRYYRSDDETITDSDIEVGSRAVEGLSASRTRDHSISLTAAPSAGTYYYGACVESVSDESDTGNNCSPAVTVTVEAAPAPDLVVDAPTVSTSSPTAGSSFRLRATVRNQGTGRSASTTLRYYRSTDATVTTSDTEVGTDPVGALGASRTSAESISLRAPSSAGTYYYGACVESVSGESDTGNNCSSAVTVTMRAPDLVVDAPTVNNSSPTTGTSFTLRATVRNQGAARSGSTTLRFYRSDDETITDSDTEVGSQAVGGLSASRTRDHSISLRVPASAGTYYYGACVESVSDESDTGNNCSPAVTVTVGDAPAPDLVVDVPTVSNSSPTAGASFTLRATVRNQGSGRSSSTTLRYYRSTDATVSTSDTEVGTDLVSSLSASRTSSESISLRAPSDADTYYYGACVESVSDESDTGNNCSAAATVTVGAAPAPDLVVDTPTVSNSSPDAGSSFRLSATVRNQGNGQSSATTVRFYRSSDATISTSDTQVGTDAVISLSASGTWVESISLRAPSSPGTYYYGACVESVSDETDTGNNCSSAVTVTVGAAPAPDLVVESPTVSTSSPTASASFTLRATVRNQGSGQSAATTLRYYRSTDATVTTSDTKVGTDLVSSLSASQTSSEWISLRAPSDAGTYYYGACVESVSDETDTGNNCSAAVTVTVGAAPAPDLVVDAPTVSNSSPTAGASFRLRATVRNQGSGRSSLTTLRYYRSTDASVSTSDTEVGTDRVSSLSASRTSSEWTSLRAPSDAGTYYYGACVESVSDESDTGNNCSPAVTVTVGAAPAPDLVVESPTVSTSSPTAGASFTLSATVRNQGNGQSAATTLRYYRSTDATVSTSDTEVGTDPVSLSASGTSPESISLTAPSSAGIYYYGACVESVSDETDTGNNCSSAVTVTVGAAPTPDLVVDAPAVSTSSPTAGASFTLSATVRNQGNGQSAATTLRYYRSTDATVSTSDTEVGTDPVGSLSASRTSSESISLTAPSDAGTYYYGACVDAVSGESDTGNNCSPAVSLNVGAPDLVVDTPTVSDSSPTAERPFELHATVRNQGAGRSASTTLRYYLSTDAAITTSDTQVGTDEVGGLSASETSAEWISLSFPASAGTYYYGACIESVSGETDTGNNCSPALTVTVGAPDLVVDVSVSTSSPAAGASFRLSATVRNQGNGWAAITTLRFYRSDDGAISASDTELESEAEVVPNLPGNGTSGHATDLTAPSSAGTYYYGACVESVSGESDTGNNCSPVTVEVVASDLVVDSPDFYKGSPAGLSFEMNARVRNQGPGRSGATTVRFFRSTDAAISDSDTEVGSLMVGRLEVSGTSGHAIWLTAPSSEGTYYYGACVDAVSAESDTRNNCSAAVTVTVTQAWKLYWSTGGKVQRSNLDGSDVEDLVTGLRGPKDIALDVAGNKMYWVDQVYWEVQSSDKIQRSNLDGSGVEDLVTTGLDQPEAIALDVAGGKMYWVDQGTDKIQRSNLDGSGVEDLVTTGLDQPEAIALDVAGGKMYWVDQGTNKTQRSNLDGSGVEELLTELWASPSDIVLDVAGGKIYWVSRVGSGNPVRRSNLDGSGTESVVSTTFGSSIALDVAGRKIYWGNDFLQKIQRANLDGSDIEDLVTDVPEPHGVALGLVPLVAGTD